MAAPRTKPTREQLLQLVHRWQRAIQRLSTRFSHKERTTGDNHRAIADNIGAVIFGIHGIGMPTRGYLFVPHIDQKKHTNTNRGYIEDPTLTSQIAFQLTDSLATTVRKRYPLSAPHLCQLTNTSAARRTPHCACMTWMEGHNVRHATLRTLDKKDGDLQQDDAKDFEDFKIVDAMRAPPPVTIAPIATVTHLSAIAPSSTDTVQLLPSLALSTNDTTSSSTTTTATVVQRQPSRPHDGV